MKRALIAAMVLGCGGSSTDNPDARFAIPETTLEQAPPPTTRDPVATFAFSAQVPATFSCALDGGPAEPCLSPWIITVEEGTHSAAIAADGDPTPVAVGWYVDLTPPTTTISGVPPSVTGATSAELILNGDEAIAAFACSLNGSAEAPCDSALTLTGLSVGPQALAVRATDLAGHVEDPPALATWTIEAAPDTSISAPSGIVAAGTFDVTFSSATAAAFSCARNAGAWVACTSPWSVVGSTDGPITVEVRAVTAAGTVDPTPAAATWTVDATAPALGWDGTPPTAVASSTPSFAFLVDDAAATTTCRLDGVTAFAPCTGAWSAAAQGQGSYVARVRALDAVGNAAELTHAFSIDQTAPTVTLTSGPVGQTTDDTPTFTFTVDDAGAAVTCAVDGGAATTCTSPLTLGPLTVAAHTLDVFAQDAAGNVGSASRSFDVVAAAGPSALVQQAMAYDPARGRLVLFGGGAAVLYDETWEWDGVGWQRVVTANAPSPRAGPAFAYSPQLRRLVLFGGFDGSVALADTWAFDGVDWTELSPMVLPTPRHSSGLAYCPTRQALVLFGGFDSVRMDDTWEFDGAEWSPRLTTARPTPRLRHAMAFHAGRDRVVLFGGNDGVDRDDTWEYDGDWQEFISGGPPPARRYVSMSYDTARGSLVLFGGFQAGLGDLGDTWELGVGDWGAVIPIMSPSARFAYAMGFDQRRERTVMFGGTIDGGPAYDETWTYDGTWEEPTAAVPGPRSQPALAYDAGRGRVVMFGGSLALAGDETWEHDGQRWNLSSPAQRPPARTRHGLTYDAARGVVVLFGGNDSGGLLDDTWTYDGATWTEVVTPSRPPARAHPGLAYDSLRARVLLFGGDAGSFAGDLWAFDGSDWTEFSPGPGPSPRVGAGLAYDAVADRLIVVGGQDVGGDVGDAWAFDGTSWSTLPSGGAPPARSFARLSADPARDRLLLTGGFVGGFATAEVWSLTGTTWTARSPLATPRRGHGQAFHAPSDQLVIFGGFDGVMELGGEIWREPPAAAAEACAGGVDYDGDGDLGCTDADCWSVCTPLCAPPQGSCPALAPFCGDGTCQPVEDCRSCPGDCPVGVACPVRCGDLFCDPSELATCAADCP